MHSARGIYGKNFSEHMVCNVDIHENLFVNVVSPGDTAFFKGTGKRMFKELTALAPFSMMFRWLLHLSESAHSVWIGAQRRRSWISAKLMRNAFCTDSRVRLEILRDVGSARPPRNLMLNWQRHVSRVFFQRCTFCLSSFFLSSSFSTALELNALNTLIGQPAL